MQANLMTCAADCDQARITQQVFLAMAEIDIEPTVQPAAPSGPSIISSLRFSEPSSGIILIETAVPLAMIFTQRFMALPMPTHVDDNVIDAMGELANMIGGNLKGLMPEETAITIPEILSTDAAGALVRQAISMHRLDFKCPFGDLSIRLLDM